jgi:3,4-dihydroxy 2-butanone 4-phosphate synthase/GTP cyclohydrolase II
MMADASTPKLSANIATAARELGRGRMIVIEEEEGGAHLALGAEFAGPSAVNFMAREGRGLICLALTPERCWELGLELIPVRVGLEAEAPKAFTVSIEAREGITTGISAADRARTIAVAVDPTSTEGDLVTPGHVFPLRARSGGVLERPGEAESAIDLALIAGIGPAVVLCTIMADDGHLATGRELAELCERHDLVRVTVKDLCRHRRRSEQSADRGVRSAYQRVRALFGRRQGNAALSLGSLTLASDTIRRGRSPSGRR